MTSEKWQQVKQICGAALELSPELRPAFLVEACNGETDVRREVEVLLDSFDSQFLEQPVIDKALEQIINRGLVAGQTFSHYKVREKIGAGGMGEVYRARDTLLDRPVALKVLLPEFCFNAERVRRFQLEARAASALNHPNILTIHEIGASEDSHFIASEFVEGETLRDRLKGESLSLDETLEISIQIAAALQAAHASGIVHRDIKPENVMIRQDGLIKVLDFGLAKLTETKPLDAEAETRAQIKTQSGMILGTAAYMSPEQARGQKIDARTDVWSLGVVLYEMLTKKQPFGGETTSDAIAAILKSEPPPLAQYILDVPPELEQIVGKSLRKDRAERYQHSQDLLIDLKDLKQNLEFAVKLKHFAAPATSSEQTAKKPPAGETKPPKYIQTVHTQGYRFIAKIDETKESDAETKNDFAPVQPDAFVPTKKRTASNFLSLKMLAVFGIIAAVLAVGFFVWKSRQEQIETVKFLKPSQITTWTSLDIYPAFSPDGNSIAYSSDHGGNFEIYVKPLAPGANEIQLTSDGQQNFQPAFSPDGKFIAFYSKNRGGLWIVPATGGKAKQLTQFGSCPAWSPDGKTIAFQSDGLTALGAGDYGAFPPSTIWIVAAQGGAEPTQLTQTGNPVGGHSSPMFSPDGKRLAFATYDIGGSEIWTISADGKDMWRIVANEYPKALFDPIYAPDGKTLFFSGGSSNSWALRKISISPASGAATGEQIELLDTGSTLYKHLRLSPDGSRLVYTALSLRSNLWSLPLSSANDEATAPPMLLTHDTAYRKSPPSFSPDGRKIAFTRLNTGTNIELCLMDADGQNQTQISTLQQYGISGWLPDGNQVAFLRSQGEKKVLSAVALDTGRELALLEINQNAESVRISPDGKRLVFSSNKSGTVNIWTISIEGGEARALTFDKELAGYPCWSPDGKTLGFQIKRGNDTHIGVISSDGGEITQLTFDKGQSWAHSFSPDGDKIVFAGFRNGVWNLYWVSRSTKQQKQLTNYTKLNSYVRYPTWSPLGNQIAFEYAETTGNIWVADLK
ncbi:MAG: serine/threonine-protein kinase [Acidobacteriota bacterium]|nr:serine/threonine-protein kinase [Acidobacteriota bacterium]